ncbi:MAG: hypothetical protein ABW252_19535 [Polyangiales bacterium]
MSLLVASLQTAGAGAQDLPASSGHERDVTIATDWRGWTKDDCDQVVEIRARARNAPTPFVVPVGEELQARFSFEPAWPYEPVQAVGFQPILDQRSVVADFALYAGGRLIWDWYPGDRAKLALGSAAGIEMPWGQGVFSLVVHYWNGTGPEKLDQSGVALCLVREGRLRPSAAGVVSLGARAEVPARTRDHVASRTCTYQSDQPVTVISAAPGLHKLGTAARLSVAKPSGSALHVIDGPYRFGERETVTLARPLRIEKGDRITSMCVYDNMSARDVPSGWRTSEETCRFTVVYYPKVDFVCD